MEASELLDNAMEKIPIKPEMQNSHNEVGEVTQKRHVLDKVDLKFPSCLNLSQ